MHEYLYCKVICGHYNDNNKFICTGFLKGRVLRIKDKYMTVALEDTGLVDDYPINRIVITDSHIVNKVIEPGIYDIQYRMNYEKRESDHYE